MNRLLVTGAGGFLGRHVVEQALLQELSVVALVRSRNQAPASWLNDANVMLKALDLANREAEDLLIDMFCGVDTVVHAAATLTGTDQDHMHNTIGSMNCLINAMRAYRQRGNMPPRLVLVSSLAVYGYAALPEDVIIDERTPVESDRADRDAYCRAKIEQERIAIQAAQNYGLEVRIIRVGTVYGAGRTWSARLGLKMGPIVVTLGGRSAVPAIHVAHCARALVNAARLPLGLNDVPIECVGGRLDIVNLLDPNPPSQQEWLMAIGCLRMIRLPWGIISRISRLLSAIRALGPIIEDKVPISLREPTLAARFKPLQYSCARAEDRLNHKPVMSFVDAMRRSGIDSAQGNETIG